MTKRELGRQDQRVARRGRSRRRAERVALLSEAVRLSDLSQNIERSTYLREELFTAAFDCGQYERALAEFNTMLNAADAHADSFGAEIMPRLLWLYKWVAEHAHKYTVGQQGAGRQHVQGHGAALRRGGLSMRAIYSLRTRALLEMGDVAHAQKDFQRWIDAEEDGSEDCPACELNSYVEFLLWSGDTEQAIDKAKPLLAGKMRCAEVPGITQSLLLIPMLTTGRADQAAKGHKASFRQMRENRKFIGYAGQHLQYLAAMNDFTPAVKLLESRLAWALETRNGQDKLQVSPRCAAAPRAPGGARDVRRSSCSCRRRSNTFARTASTLQPTWRTNFSRWRSRWRVNSIGAMAISDMRGW
jgi:tetratricopeptide (TPR) repeat protein